MHKTKKNNSETVKNKIIIIIIVMSGSTKTLQLICSKNIRIKDKGGFSMRLFFLLILIRPKS